MQVYQKEKNRFMFALQFLTIIPVRLKAQPSSEVAGKSVLYFPAIGLIIGAFLYVFYLALREIYQGVLLDVSLLGFWVLLSRAMHLDGVGDVFDGFYAGRDRDEILMIMKDPHIGAMGMIGIAVFLIFKLGCIYSLPSEIKPGALLFVPGIARGMALIPAYFLPYAREEGTGRDFIKHKDKLRLIVAILLSSLICLLFGLKGFLVAGINTAGLGLLTLFLKKRITGVTGDCLGFAIEFTEILSLLILCAGGQK